MDATVRFLIICLLLFCGITVLSQETVIHVTHKNGHRVRTLHEGSTIKVRTLDGDKFKGKFTVINKDTIEIDGASILLSNIKSIRRKPLAVKIVKGFFITVGVAAISIPIIAGSGGLIVASGVAIALYANLVGFTVPEFFVKTRAKPKWSFSIAENATVP